MGRRKKLSKDKLLMVASSVPRPVKAIIVKAAKQENRTVSVIVRRIIEESPSIITGLRKASK